MLKPTIFEVLFADGREEQVLITSADKLRAKRELGKAALVEEILGLMLYNAAVRNGLADAETDWLNWHESVAKFDAVAEPDAEEGYDPGEASATPAE